MNPFTVLYAAFLVADSESFMDLNTYLQILLSSVCFILHGYLTLGDSKCIFFDTVLK